MDKDPKILFKRILESIDTISQYTSDISETQFKSDFKTRDAVLMHLIVIGEVANRIPEDFREKHGHIEWMRIIRTRHLIAHEYGRVDFDVIWRIVKQHIPETKLVLEEIFNAL